MASGLLRFSLLTLVLVVVAGCGGSSGGSSGGGGGGGGNSTSVTVQFSGGTPSVVAAKIGTGSFTAETLASGRLSLSIPGDTTKFAIAYLCTAPSFPAFEDIFEATTADGTSFTLPCPSPSSPGTNGALTGNIDASGVPSANLIDLAVANGSSELTYGVTADTDFTVSAPTGTDRVEVLAYNNVSVGFTSTTTLVAARNFTGQSVPGALNGGSQVMLGAADAATSQTISYSNAPSGYGTPYTLVDYVMSGSGGFSLATATSQYPVMPSGAVASGDFYEFFATAINSSNPNELMLVAKSASSAGPVSINFPAPWTYSGPTPAANPTFNFAYSGLGNGAGIYETAVIDWTTVAGFVEISVMATGNYQAGSTTLAIPDLSGVQGFEAAPVSGTGVGWVALIAQSSVGLPQALSANGSITTVENFGNYNVP